MAESRANKRCFVGVPVDARTGEALSRLQAALREDGRVAGRAVPPENFHLTLAFLGSLDRQTCDRAAGLLEGVAAAGAADTQGLQNLCRFPGPNGRLIVAEGVPGPSLMAVRQSLQNALDAEGLPGADHGRAFRPHITLMRLRKPAAEDVDRPIELAMPVKELVLYESVDEGSGVRYRRLAGFRLPETDQ